MAVASAPYARPPLPAPARSPNTKRASGRGALSEVLRVARRDGEFLGERLRRVSGALSDLFWLRKLEAPRAVAAAPPVWPEISYPPGLSGLDLLMSDLEALKTYVNYLRHASQIWFMPLPESYDPQKVADYFSCRPHILAFRFSEVFASFASAAIKLQVSRAFKFNWHGVDNDNSSGSSQYYMGQLLKQSMLNLGPTFVKVGQSLSTRPDIIGRDISKALSELHERIPPFPTATAIKIIEEELGCPVENIFSYFSDEPVAAASFGQDLEESLGNVVFKDGIPDIKFSRVLGKIWSVALKYHFRMPPYYTLVLRSLASLEGLAVAADKDFKTFQAAYPFVVRKLLLDNSTATRRILHSVVFNKRREIQWQKILMFLRISSTRKSAIGLNMLSTEKSPVDHNLTEVFEVANLILRLLPSKDGAVMRRLLMTADGASLAGDIVSKDAAVFRRLLSRVLADVIYQRIMKAVKGSVKVQQESKTGDPRMLSISALQAVLIDRRLKVILYKIINDTRSNPVLMLRVCWSSFTVFFTASAVALHRVLIYWSETSFKSLSVLPRRFAVSL